MKNEASIMRAQGKKARIKETRSEKIAANRAKKKKRISLLQPAQTRAGIAQIAAKAQSN